MTIPILYVLPQRHKRVLSGHPWIYSNEVAMTPEAKALPPGTLVRFHSADDRILGVGSFNPHSLIAGRLFARDDGMIDADWLVVRLRMALTLRERLFKAPFYRLIHAEADGLPGLIIDRFDDVLAVQLNTAGMQVLWPVLEGALHQVLRPRAIVLRNDSAARALEHLPQETSVVYGSLTERVRLQENGLSFIADLTMGQKTGWFFDQRANRAMIARLSRDARVLDVFCHTGGFALNAAAAGAASVVGIDSSQLALDCAAEAARLNGVDARCVWQKADAFDALAARAGEEFDVVVVDPPAFVKSRKDVQSGARGYRKLTRLAAALVRPGGLLLVVSCSHHMELALFAEQLARGVQDAGRSGQILQTVFASADHPVHPALPESSYLKGQLYRLF